MRNVVLSIIFLLGLSARALAAACGSVPVGSFAPIADRQIGVTGEYPPAVFSESKPGINSHQFASPDNACRFFVSSGDNQLSATAADIEGLSELYYHEKGISVSYRRKADRWYVVTGIDHQQIYYEKGVLSRDGKRIVVLLIQYPKVLKSYFDEIVGRMSHTFWIAN